MTPPNAGKDWTEDDYAKLRVEFEAGRSIKELQDALGRTACAVVRKLLDMRLLVRDSSWFYCRGNSTPWCSPLDVHNVDSGVDDDDDEGWEEV